MKKMKWTEPWGAEAKDDIRLSQGVIMCIREEWTLLWTNMPTLTRNVADGDSIVGESSGNQTDSTDERRSNLILEGGE